MAIQANQNALNLTNKKGARFWPLGDRMWRCD